MKKNYVVPSMVQVKLDSVNLYAISVGNNVDVSDQVTDDDAEMSREHNGTWSNTWQNVWEK